MWSASGFSDGLSERRISDPDPAHSRLLHIAVLSDLSRASLPRAGDDGAPGSRSTQPRRASRPRRREPARLTPLDGNRLYERCP